MIDPRPHFESLAGLLDDLRDVLENGDPEAPLAAFEICEDMQDQLAKIMRSCFDAARAEPAFLDDDDPDAPLPTFVSTTNAYELYGLREGETVSEAIARKLTAGELEDLRQDMQSSSEWMRQELARRKQEG